MRVRPVRILVALITSLIPLALVAILLFLTLYSWPAIKFNGVHFLFGKIWDLGNLYADPVMVNGTSVPPGANYGILVFITGTLSSSFIAVLIAVTVGLAVAMFLAEGIPAPFRPALSLIVELLASVPSVVYGLWGYVVLIPFVAHYLGPALAKVLGFIPFFAGPVGSGYGLLVASLVLAIMIVPIITATVYSGLIRVPREIKEASYALGATRFEMVRKVMLRAIRKSVIGAVILGLGRALGETMAVLMVSGGALNYLPKTIYSPVTTMAAFIVSQLDSALQDPTNMAVYSLAEIALVLLLIAVVVNIIARALTGGQGHVAYS